MQRVPAEVRLPGLDRLLGDQLAESLEEIRRSHVQHLERAHLHVLEINRIIELRGQHLQLGHRMDVVGLLRVAHVGAAGRGLGQRGLNLHHRRGFLGRLIRRVAGQREHLGHVLDVLLANLLEPLAVHDVIVAIGQREAALPNDGNLLGGVLVVLLHAKTEERRRTAFGLQFAHQRGQLVSVVEGRDRLEGRFQRLQPLLLHQIRVHAGGKEVAILLFQRAFWARGRRVQLLPQQIAVAFLQQRERPRPAHLVGGNGVALDPVAASVLVKIRAGIGSLVDSR